MPTSHDGLHQLERRWTEAEIQAEYRGHPVNGEFRATHIAVHDGTQWRLAGVHLSAIGSPPPFAGRPADPEVGR